MMSRRYPKMPRPRPTQDEVLRYIRSYKADPANDGNSPTYREIATGVGKSLSTIYTACRNLEAKGLIEINARGKITLQGGKYLRPDDDPA
jgi:hypothetical protein